MPDLSQTQKGPMTVQRFLEIVEKIIKEFSPAVDGFEGEKTLVFPDYFLTRVMKELEVLRNLEKMTGGHYELMTALNVMSVVVLDKEIERWAEDLAGTMPVEEWMRLFDVRVSHSEQILGSLFEVSWRNDIRLVPMLKEASSEMRRLLANLAAPYGECANRTCCKPKATLVDRLCPECIVAMPSITFAEFGTRRPYGVVAEEAGVPEITSMAAAYIIADSERRAVKGPNKKKGGDKKFPKRDSRSRKSIRSQTRRED